VTEVRVGMISWAHVHAEFRAGKSKRIVSRALYRPWTVGRRDMRAAANVAYQAARVSVLQRRLSRLARLTAAVPSTPLIVLGNVVCVLREAAA